MRKEYEADEIVVSFDPEVCEHAANCVRGLPQVFDTKKRPWIQPENAPADEVATQVERCPSGALKFRRTVRQ